MKPPRLSRQSHAVLRNLMRAKKERSGADLTRMAGIKSGTLYPMLQRLEAAGWLTSQRERGDPVKLGRPLKRLYSLTQIGRSQAQSVLSSLR